MEEEEEETEREETEEQRKRRIERNEDNERLWHRCGPLGEHLGRNRSDAESRCPKTLKAVRTLGIHQLLGGHITIQDAIRSEKNLCYYHEQKLRQFVAGTLTDQNCTANYQILKFVHYFYYHPFLKQCTKQKWLQVARNRFRVNSEASTRLCREVINEFLRELENDEDLLSDWDPFVTFEEKGS